MKAMFLYLCNPTSITKDSDFRSLTKHEITPIAEDFLCCFHDIHTTYRTNRRAFSISGIGA